MRTIMFMSLLAVTTAARWRSALPEIPKALGDQEGCYIKETNQVVPFGKTVYPIGYCCRIGCSKSGLGYASCGVVGTEDPDCYKTEADLTKPYPDCCPRIKCKDEIQNGILQ